VKERESEYERARWKGTGGTYASHSDGGFGSHIIIQFAPGWADAGC